MEFDLEWEGPRESGSESGRGDGRKGEKEHLSTLEAVEREHIQRVLKRTGGRVYGDGGAAAILGINASTLRSRMKKLGLGGAKEHRR